MAIEIDGLAKAYGAVHALEGIDLHVPAGASYGLVGPEGAGKTTLLRILAGLEPATDGTVRIVGREMTQTGQARANLGYLPADPGIDPGRTPRELLRMAGRLHGMETSELERRLETLLIQLRLEHLGGHLIEHLTPGHRRRLALAYALVPDPDVLVVDEPTRGLTPTPTRRMREAITALCEDRSLLVATGQPSDVEHLCEHVVGLESGRAVLDAALDELEAERGIAIEIQLAGELPRPALDVLRDHGAVAALRREPEDTDADLELWITDPDRASAILLLLVENGAPVASYARRRSDLAETLDEHMEGPL